jgi:hypothetical protein
MLVNPGEVPSRRKTRSCGMRALSAAASATGSAFGRVISILESAVLSAWVISSTVYAGEAPLTRPPARMTAHMATGYHIVFVLNNETVSPGLRPYFWTKVVLSWVALSLTCCQSSRSWVMALT